MYAYEDLMAALEAEGLLDRDVEVLPSSEEMAERRRAGRGLERPELAVLLAYAKRALTGALLRSDLPDEPWLERDLRELLPAARRRALRRTCSAEHPLRRELVATIVANHVVDALGPTFVSRLMAELGAQPADVVRAYLAARDARRRDRPLGGDRAPRPGGRPRRAVGADGGRRPRSSRRPRAGTCATPSPGSTCATEIADGREAFRRLAEILPTLGAEEWRAEREEVAAEPRRAGRPGRAGPRRTRCGRALEHAPDIVAIARLDGRTVEEVAHAFFRLGQALQLTGSSARSSALPVGTRMQRWALQAVREDVLAARRLVAERALQRRAGRAADEAASTASSRRDAEGVGA